jgi:tyrosinase
MNEFDEPTNLTRRVFIKGVGYLSLGLIFSTMLGGCETILKQISNRPIRRRLRTGSAEVDADIAIYKDAVNQMKALPAGNPRSWSAQAALHGTVAGGFNFCQHGTHHFFSWHRAYLFYFEQICQELTGEKKFGLPYWNWNQNPAIHPEFTTTGSPLFHPRTNTSVAGNPAFTNATLNSILADTNFFTFNSQLEGTPHNTAHIVVGSDMATGGSPLDPVFWMHHGMVDYCWAKWNIELENDNTNDSAWNNTAWDHFVNGKGDSVNVTAGITTLMPLLSYRYETSAIGGFQAARDLAAASAEELNKLEKRLKKGADIRYDIKKRVSIARGTRLSLAKPFSAETRVPADDFAALAEPDPRTERIFVYINYAKLPAVNDFFVRVFINQPTANTRTPTDDMHYAGSFAFFGTDTGGRSHRHEKTDFLVNVTDTLQKLKSQGKWRTGQPITVQLVAVPATNEFIRPETELTLEGIDLIVSPVSIRSR